MLKYYDGSMALISKAAGYKGTGTPWNWYTGKTKPEDIAILRIAEDCGCDLNWLQTGEGSAFPLPRSVTAKRIAANRDLDKLPLAWPRVGRREPVLGRHGVNHDAGQPEKKLPLPLYGRIPAGQPSEIADEEVESYGVLGHLAADHRYVLRVTGDSMMDMLWPDDLIVMEHNTGYPLEMFHGQVCAVLLDGEATLKKVDVHAEADGIRITLRAENRSYPPISFRVGEREFAIQGVFVALVQRLGPWGQGRRTGRV